MVESLKELNQICQKPHYKEVGNWMVRHILRDAALPITWLLLHTSITANQVTLISLGFAILGMAFFTVSGVWSFVIAIFLLQAWYLLDHVDGQVARYRKTASLTGRFYDFIMHHFVHGALFFTFGVYAFFKWDHFFWLLLGFTGCMAIMLFNLANDTKYKTFFEKLSQDRPEALNLSHPSQTSSRESQPPSLKRRIFSVLHKSCEIHVVLNVLTAACLLQLVLGGTDLRALLAVLYSLAAIILGMAKLSFVILTKKIDSEFGQTFNYSSPKR